MVLEIPDFDTHPLNHFGALRFTRFTALKPARLSKRFTLAGDALLKEGGGDLTEGIAERLIVADLAEFAALLPTLRPNQALSYGTNGHARARVVTASALAGAAGQGGEPVIARTRDYFTWPAGAGVLMLDYDPPQDGPALSRDELRATLAAACPALADAPAVWRPSASSCIFTKEGAELRGIKGQRLYLPVLEAADIPRALKVLFDRLWLAGHGRYELSKSGAWLARSAIDASVAQPERLDFCGGADCGPGLEQRLPDPISFNETAPHLDTRAALPDLDAGERRRLADLLEAAKDPLRAEQRRIRAEWIETRVGARLDAMPEAERAQARPTLEKIYREAAEGGWLGLDFQLMILTKGARGVASAKPMTVRELLATPEARARFNESTCKDPLEPDYPEGQGRFVGWICTAAREPYLVSQAHGGARYLLGEAPATQARPVAAGPAGAVEDENLFSDYGNVVKLQARLSGRLSYSPGMGWLLYAPDKGIWEPEPGAERVKNLVLETLREAWGEVLDEAAIKSESIRKQRKELDDDDPGTATLDKRMKYAAAHRTKMVNWVRQCETAYRIRSTLEIAEGYLPFWTRPDTWDADPNILVCNNGVLDLATGSLLPHSPDYRATKTTGTDFIPGARHPAWDAVVALLQAEGDRYEFVHHYCGSGLHGENPNEQAVIFQGDGGTGKGTLLTAIHRALGAYAETVEVGTLLATDWRKQNKSAPREDLLKLRGARFVYPSLEPPKDSKIDDASFKALVGNDAITARYPFARDSITFYPVFKLVVQTNFPLRTEFDDPGMKRRVIVVPFNQKPERPDPAIKNALINDPTARAACLAWLYEGYRGWRANGFVLPASMLATQATADYWADMNPYEQFAADVGLKFGKLERCHKPKMTGAFKAWRDETGRFDASLKGFPGWLKSKGCFDQQVTGGSRLWYGVGFAEASSQQSQESPPVPANTSIDFQYSKSTNEFTGTASDSGYRCYGGSGNPAPGPVAAKPSPACVWDRWGERLLARCDSPEPNQDRTGCANCGASKPAGDDEERIR